MRCRRVIPRYPAGKRRWGGALVDRYEITGAPADLARSLGLLAEAFAEYPDDDPTKALALNNWVNAVLADHERTGDPAGLRTVLVRLTGLTTAFAPPHPMFPVVASNAGLLARQAAHALEHPELIDDAVRFHEAAVTGTDPDHPALPARLAQLAVGLGDRYARNGDVGDLARAIELGTRGLDSASSHDVELVGFERAAAGALAAFDATRAVLLSPYFPVSPASSMAEAAYLALWCTPVGGAALVVRPDSAPASVALPDLTPALAARLAERLSAAALLGPGSMDRVLALATDRISRTITRPLERILSAGESVVCAPGGALALLPLSAGEVAGRPWIHQKRSHLRAAPAFGRVGSSGRGPATRRRRGGVRGLPGSHRVARPSRRGAGVGALRSAAATRARNRGDPARSARGVPYGEPRPRGDARRHTHQ